MEPIQSSQMPQAPAAHRRSRPDPGDRLAVWLRRLRWPVVIAWLIAIVALNPIANSLSNVTNNTAAANLQSSAQSTRVVELQQAAQSGHPDVDQAVVVFARDGGLTSADLAAAADARRAVARLRSAGFGAPGPLRRSADRQAVLFVANVTSSANNETSNDTAAVQAIRRVVAGPASRAGTACRPR